MKQPAATTHLDWEIRTIVGIDSPDKWEPGDLRRYLVRRGAELAYGGDRFSYSTDTPQVFSTAHSSDERLARRFHGEATMRLRQLIDKLTV